MNNLNIRHPVPVIFSYKITVALSWRNVVEGVLKWKYQWIVLAWRNQINWSKYRQIDESSKLESKEKDIISRRRTILISDQDFIWFTTKSLQNCQLHFQKIPYRKAKSQNRRKQSNQYDNIKNGQEIVIVRNSLVMHKMKSSFVLRIISWNKTQNNKKREFRDNKP